MGAISPKWLTHGSRAIITNPSARKEGLESPAPQWQHPQRAVPLYLLFSSALGHHLPISVCEFRQNTVTSLQFSKVRGSTIIQAYLLRYGHGSTNKTKSITIYGTLQSGLIIIGFSVCWLWAQTRVTAADADFWISSVCQSPT